MELKRWALGAILAVCWVTPVIQAQQPSPASKPKPPPPSGPLLAPAPDFSEWQIAFAYPQDKKDKQKTPVPTPLNPELPRTILVTKTQKVIHEQIALVSGKTMSKWQLGQDFYLKPPGQSYWGFYNSTYFKNNPTSDATYMPVPENGFRDLDWVSGETYAGTIQSAAGAYLVFVPENARTIDVSNAKALQAATKIVYVNAQTRLPGTVRLGDVVRTYTFRPPPAAPQSLPADLAAEKKKSDEINARFKAAPAKEY